MLLICKSDLILGFLSCAPSPCKYGGKCVLKPKGESYCNCTSRYIGEFCEYPNPCHTGPRCQNGGTCVGILKDGQPSFTCKCPLEYSASLCEIHEPNACDSSPCLNGGTCGLKTLSEFKCACAEGYSGKFCEKQNLCASSPCRNGGSCTLVSGDKFKCICPKGFKGPNCNDDVEECQTNPCMHGGTCLNTHGSYQ